MKRWLQSMRHVLGNKQTRPGAGYTIMELIIVLAVSTGILFAAILALQGRQGQVQFTQAVRNYEARLQNVINDVAKGYYQAGFSCIVNSGVISFPGTTQGGTNKDCIFLGKALASHSDGADILTIIGRRTLNGSDVTSYTDAIPTALNDGTNLVTESLFNSYGLRITRILWLGGAGNTQVADFAFVNQLSGGAVASSGTARSVLLYGAKTSPLSKATTATAGQLDTMEPLPEGILICLMGGNGKRAEIRLGENNSQTTLYSVLNTSSAGACP